ncbi:MAG TPA: hypothetical protein VNO43_04965 [Candidatus Eisenbacteria bacterium]|nr:hypothetical protein [Candidatus Eisenbacteria bacterium]
MQDVINLFYSLPDSDRRIVLGLFGLAALLFIVQVVRSYWAREKAKVRAHLMRKEAENFFRDLELRKKLPAVSVDIVLKEGEVGIFQEPSILYETRAYRIYGGGGTRIRGIYIGGGASESHQRLRQIDQGKLTLTNQRLVFDGQSENRATNLKDVISASPWSDAVEVSSSKRQKSQIYAVGNPIIWAQVIQMFASGKIEVGKDEAERIASLASGGRDF